MLRLFRAPPPPSEISPTLEVAYAGHLYRIAVKRVARARRYTLRVRAATGDAVLTMPASGTLRAARLFAERHAAWVGSRMQALPGKVSFTVGTTIPLRGELVPIVQAGGLRRTAYLDQGLRPDGHIGAVIKVGGTAQEQGRRVVVFLQGEARADLTAAVARHAATVGRAVRGLTLRDTRSRWGSCTSRGTLNFSWRLVMAPPVVLDYLAAHEVAHLVHLDHSPAYWAVAERLAPRLAEAEAWLRAHGAELHRFNAGDA